MMILLTNLQKSNFHLLFVEPFNNSLSNERKKKIIVGQMINITLFLHEYSTFLYKDYN